MGVTRDGPAELALAFVALNRYLQGGEIRTAAQRLVELAVESVPGCDWASIASVPTHRPPHSMAHSDDVAAQVDALQYGLGDGPSVTAAVTGDVVHIADLGGDVRWREFTAAARAATQVRSLLAIPLVDRTAPSTLTLYSATERAFGGEAIDQAALFAAHARVLLLHADTAAQVANLGLALRTSRQIGTAVGS